MAPRFLIRTLLLLLLLVSTLGLVAELWYYYSPSELSQFWVGALSLSYEANLPTWYATCLLFSCGLCLAAITRRSYSQKEINRHHWALLSILFFYLSLDEAVGIHEHLGGRFSTGGVFYFDWVIPAAILVLILGVLFIPFLIRLPSKTRQWFIGAGLLYVGGALLMELPLGYWTERHGAQNFTYALIDFVEEVLELLGASLFLVALWNYFSRTSPTAKIS